MSWPTEKNAKNVYTFSQAAGFAAMQMVLLTVRNSVVHSQMQVYLELNLPMSEELPVWGLCFRSIPGTSFSARSFFWGSIFPPWLDETYLWLLPTIGRREMGLNQQEMLVWWFLDDNLPFSCKWTIYYFPLLKYTSCLPDACEAWLGIQDCSWCNPYCESSR